MVAAIAVYFARGYVKQLYSNDLPVILVAVDLLLFVVLYQFFDDTQVTASGALRGFKDTRTPMWVAIVSYWFVGLPVGVALGFLSLGVTIANVNQGSGHVDRKIYRIAGADIGCVHVTPVKHWR